MTIVELYDDKPINNVVGALVFNPEKLIYVGGHSRKTFERKKLSIIKNYLEHKGLADIQVEYIQVRRDSLKDIIDNFEDIYANNEDCKFHVEVTGGEDLILVGLGVLCQRHPEIELYQISSKLRNIRSFSVESDDGDKIEVNCSNTVDDNLQLHGASVVTANGKDCFASGYVWGIEFLHDVNVMWEICCKGVNEELSQKYSSPNLWNRVSMILGKIDSFHKERENKNSIRINKKWFNEFLLKDNNTAIVHEYLYCFVRHNLMDYRIENNYVYLDFKNDQIRYCLTKAGQILELKTYITCLELVGRRGGDCLTGVTIDWDGDEDIGSDIKYLYNPDDPESKIDTINEVDVVATCGLVPYFISCKNGAFTPEELYKLYSIGERFGKGYCRKIIVSTNLTYSLGSKKQVYMQRAADMGIDIIENVHEMTDDEFSEELKRVMELPKQRVMN